MPQVNAPDRFPIGDKDELFFQGHLSLFATNEPRYNYQHFPRATYYSRHHATADAANAKIHALMEYALDKRAECFYSNGGAWFVQMLYEVVRDRAMKSLTRRRANEKQYQVCRLILVLILTRVSNNQIH